MKILQNVAKERGLRVRKPIRHETTSKCYISRTINSDNLCQSQIQSNSKPHASIESIASVSRHYNNTHVVPSPPALQKLNRHRPHLHLHDGDTITRFISPLYIDMRHCGEINVSISPQLEIKTPKPDIIDQFIPQTQEHHFLSEIVTVVECSSGGTSLWWGR